jgi:hypothetical protein
VLDAQGRVCAHATGTFKYVSREVGDTNMNEVATD